MLLAKLTVRSRPIADIPILGKSRAMPELLHEYWESEAGATFGAVREHNDRVMPTIFPNARLVSSLRAASWFQAMRLHYEEMDFGEFVPPEDEPDHFYTAEEAAEQEAYLRVRNLR